MSTPEEGKPQLTQAQAAQPQAGPSTTPAPTTAPPPALPSPAPTASAVSKPVSPNKKPLDLRAEEEAARRHNVGRALVSQSRVSGNTSDLFGPGSLQKQMKSMFAKTNTTFDDEALQYLSQAAEARLRSLLSQALSTQIHRTSSSHTRQPPLSKTGKPLWDHAPTNDISAIYKLLAQQNKDAEQKFRANRMDRIARETDIARAKEKERERDEIPSAAPEVDVSAASGSAAGPSTPMKESSGPTFGGVSEKKKWNKSSGKKNMMSADVQHKMSNMTAIRSTGFMNKKTYSWLSQPAVSSPLAGKKRKAKEEKDDSEAEAEASGSEAKNGAGPGPSKLGQQVEGVNGDAEGRSPSLAAGGSMEKVKKRKKIKLTEPTRREVVVSREGDKEKRVQDDQAITMQDVLFVLDKEGIGRGLAGGDEMVRKAWVLGGHR